MSIAFLFGIVVDRNLLREKLTNYLHPHDDFMNLCTSFPACLIMHFVTSVNYNAKHCQTIPQDISTVNAHTTKQA